MFVYSLTDLMGRAPLYSAGMGRSPKTMLIARLGRIRDLTNDLARDLSRHGGNNTEFHRAMVEAIQREAAALRVQAQPSPAPARTNKTR